METKEGKNDTIAAEKQSTEPGHSNNNQPTMITFQMVSYYKWRTKHHQWLNAQMQQALGEKNAPRPLHFNNTWYPVHLDPDNHLDLEPRRHYIMHYKMRISIVTEATNPVEAYCQATIGWYNKILMVNSKAVIYPWGEVDRQMGTTAIEDPDELPTSFLSIKKYTPKAWAWLKGGTVYPKILVGLEMAPTTVVEDISWWLQYTKQGMWPSQLQVAEETTCLGWLLFSTDKLDKEALQKEIWQIMGVQVALRYWAIDNRVPKSKSAANNKESKEKVTKALATSPVKALHLEINVLEPYMSHCRVETIFSSTAEVFPHDIKLWLKKIKKNSAF